MALDGETLGGGTNITLNAAPGMLLVFCTCSATVPLEDCVPLIDIVVELTNFVVTATPFINATAPDAKPLPDTVAV